MLETIYKRDGRAVPFNIEKIVNAIYKASLSVGINDYERSFSIGKKVARSLEVNTNPITIESIQDMVEKTLIEEKEINVAKAYILYRNERTQVREKDTRLMKIYDGLTFKEAKDSDVKRENANIDGDTAMGTMLKYGSEGAKEFYKMFVLKPEHKKAHQDGDIHIHDLDFLTLTTTCCQIDIVKLLAGGFNTGHGYLREPNDIQSYAALACIAIQSNQNDQHGGQSIPNFDYGMALGVEKTYKKLYRNQLLKSLELLLDTSEIENQVSAVFVELENKGFIPKLQNMETYLEEEEQLLEKIKELDFIAKAQQFAVKVSEEEIRKRTFQAMEAFIHNLNTMHSRAGAQTPFSSINYGTDTSPEGRLVIEGILKATEEGLGNGETPIFPIQIFKVKEGINYFSDDNNYDLFKMSCQVSGKRLFPNYAFIDAPFNLQYYEAGKPETEIAYMGCRTRVIANEYDSSRAVVNGRGNLSFTTINLPRLAILNQDNLEGFYKDLDEKIYLVIDQLLERYYIQSKKKIKNFPFLMGQGVWLDSDTLEPDEEIGEVLKHGTLTIGFIGLGETLKALVGKHHGESEEAQKLGLEIIGYMREKLDQASKSYQMNFSLIGTPAEGLSGRFVAIDKEKFGSIEGVTDREYYTNSFHVPVYYNTTIFNKIKIESPYHALTNGGHISYVEVDGDPVDNINAFEKIVKAMKDAGMGYGSINHPVDRDPVCGYTGIIKDRCPQCNRLEGYEPFERIRRITGYLVGTLDRFNNGKKAEEKDRVKHGRLSAENC
ncbi:anaerobic ribonucleoside triphosphate reductase [endosymbiont 'TC1' of Trimyema compressum]|uniref:anaerobic ribonucleoside triphosphate reductase n=1 Tax=endosymbiont 'TC1' of Trimyema compressum TaxID=243899 RepID=UPI0007F04B5A|nr:anaerobic ribonucleoside triphosphate reductase [endosymbiont 'TC1' of Trimyema compressum]AMP20242.1 anaerobic ribonucleoside triphosphate reductase [endosymbiont 'TC1' of Trimyema compressum]